MLSDGISLFSIIIKNTQNWLLYKAKRFLLLNTVQFECPNSMALARVAASHHSRWHHDGDARERENIWRDRKPESHQSGDVWLGLSLMDLLVNSKEHK